MSRLGSLLFMTTGAPSLITTTCIASRVRTWTRRIAPQPAVGALMHSCTTSSGDPPSSGGSDPPATAATRPRRPRRVSSGTWPHYMGVGIAMSSGPSRRRAIATLQTPPSPHPAPHIRPAYPAACRIAASLTPPPHGLAAPARRTPLPCRNTARRGRRNSFAPPRRGETVLNRTQSLGGAKEQACQAGRAGASRARPKLEAGRSGPGRALRRACACVPQAAP